jgi:hypothetical protein
LAVGGGSISGPFIFGPAYGVILGLVSGLVGYVATTSASKEPPYSWLQQLRQIVATTMVSAVLVIVAIFFVNRIVASEQQTGILNVAGYTHVFSIFGAGIILGAAFGIVVIWRTLRWRRGLAFGLFIGTAFALLVALLLRSPGVDHLILPLPGGRMLYELRGGEALFVLGSLTAVGAFSLLLSLTYVLVRRIAGAWAGAVAGTLATAGFHLFTNLAVGLYDLPLNLGASLVLIVAGLTMDWWRPVLFYLFESGWNLLLYRIDSLS